jgi:hypothetical protein
MCENEFEYADTGNPLNIWGHICKRKEWIFLECVWPDAFFCVINLGFSISNWIHLIIPDFRVVIFYVVVGILFNSTDTYSRLASKNLEKRPGDWESSWFESFSRLPRTFQRICSLDQAHFIQQLAARVPTKLLVRNLKTYNLSLLLLWWVWSIKQNMFYSLILNALSSYEFLLPVTWKDYNRRLTFRSDCRNYVLLSCN